MYQAVDVYGQVKHHGCHRQNRNRTSWYRPIMVQNHYGTEPLWYIGNCQVIKSEFCNCEVIILKKYIQKHYAAKKIEFD